MIHCIFLTEIIPLILLIFIIVSSQYRMSKGINKVNSIIPPSIINEQSYFFVKTKYRNITFRQYIRSDDFLSDYIKKYAKWGECEAIFDIWNSSMKRGIFLDIGANIGSCSFLFAQIGVKVIAFEPLANNLFPFTVTTYSNIIFNKYITIYPYALGKKEEDKLININKHNWGASSIYRKNKDYQEKIHVKKLDEFNKLIPDTISLLKIDVEGYEYNLLEGGVNFFKSHKIEYIFIESVCGKRNKLGIYEIEKLYFILSKLGFEIIKKIECWKSSLENVIAKQKSL